MKIENKSNRDYVCFDVVLKAGTTVEVKDEKTAKILLKQDGVIEAIDAEEVEKLKKELELTKAKARATELGIKFAGNIGLAKLQEKIAEAEANA